MNYIDHPLLYSDDFGTAEWTKLVDTANSRNESFWRKYARRKMRRVSKELLRGVRPRIKL